MLHRNKGEMHEDPTFHNWKRLLSFKTVEPFPQPCYCLDFIKEEDNDGAQQRTKWLQSECHRAEMAGILGGKQNIQDRGTVR